MNPTSTPSFHALQYYATASYPCSYRPGIEARSQVAAPLHLIDPARYSQLVSQGFRRSGLFIYRPHCPQCRACVPIRVDVQAFAPTRTQRRAQRRHAHLAVRTLPLHWYDDHYALYQRYQAMRHPADQPVDDDQAVTHYRQFLLTSGVDTALVEFREPDTGELRMVSLVDHLDDGLSAVYTFYDPQASGSLGVYGVLWQVQHCRERDLPWLYLGYWIQDCRKMTYKQNYRPYQLLEQGRWQTPGSPLPLL